MPLVLGFDFYGTLVDPFGIEQSLGTVFGDPGSAIAALWRQKQLEYSFRRGLMRCYEDFDACIDRASTLAARTFKVELSDGARRQLLTDYLNLPAFCDVLPALETLKASGFRLLAFSNGVENERATTAWQRRRTVLLRGGGQRGRHQNIQAKSRRVCISCESWRLFA